MARRRADHRERARSVCSAPGLPSLQIRLPDVRKPKFESVEHRRHADCVFSTWNAIRAEWRDLCAAGFS